MQKGRGCQLGKQSSIFDTILELGFISCLQSEYQCIPVYCFLHLENIGSQELPVYPVILPHHNHSKLL